MREKARILDLDYVNSGSSQPMSEVSPWGNTTKQDFDSLPVYDMFPLSDWQNNTPLVWYACFYAILFLVGIVGNTSVITIIRHVHTGVTYDNTMIYILFLCFVDLCSIIPLPMAIIDQLLGFWMFGTGLCKLYRILEHVGRLLSTFILAAMAFDRYLRVCHPCKVVSRKTVIYQLVLLSCLTFVLLSPLLIRSSSEEIILKEVLLENPHRIARVRIFKCVDHLEETQLAIFLSYMFLLGFFLPVVLILLFYGLMIKRLISRSRAISKSQLPITRVTTYTIAISLFFICSWTPYWSAMLYLNIFRPNTDEAESEATSERFILIMYGIHLLAYGNAAFNFLLYGLLNSELMRKANDSKKYVTTSVTLKRESSRLTANVQLKNEWDETSSGHRTQDALL